MNRFIARDRYVTACMWDGDPETAAKMKSWIESDGATKAQTTAYQPGPILVTMPGNEHFRVELGQWVVRDSRGNFRVMSRKQFETAYDPDQQIVVTMNNPAPDRAIVPLF